MLFIVTLGIIRAGDIFLSFLGEELHIYIAYKNHSGFLSCFILRFIELDKPVFGLKDFDLELGCQKAYIEPGFDKLLAEKTIILKCTLKDASFLGVKGGGGLSALFDKITDNVYDTIYAKLFIYNDRVRFPFCSAYSKDIRLYASGSMTEKGDLDLSMKVFFSPFIAAQFPEELSDILTQESGGWVSYRLHIENGKDKPFLKFESDKFRLNFEQVEIH
ncbi:MAG: hypothetical protein JSV93_00135 [Candidatus Omnitrophota bacterium]|nr:MAG: hypothetical protein JSV93_00135 [Candidatus Omnitrophota bacterium]